ncbi:hypothetical protein AMECASPLE_025398 [Ameca splendens]|uniref:Uncharacterized protein n=1 Tax=Ameca splendens TaxID=208324 RepID=A0ABV0XHL2_9TELE
MNLKQSVSLLAGCSLFPTQIKRGESSGGHVWPPLRRITGSLSALQTSNGSPLSLWQQPRTLEGPQTGTSKQMPIINVAIWRCQCCQSALQRSTPSPRPVRGQLIFNGLKTHPSAGKLTPKVTACSVHLFTGSSTPLWSAARFTTGAGVKGLSSPLTWPAPCNKMFPFILINWFLSGGPQRHEHKTSL